jgi:hypothetical protein
MMYTTHQYVENVLWQSGHQPVPMKEWVLIDYTIVKESNDVLHDPRN